MKKVMSVLLCAVMALTLCAGLAGCAKEETPATDQAASGEPIYVAIAVPMTGNQALYGEYFTTSAKIKVDEVNAAGGVNGRQIVLDVYDDRGDVAEASNLAQKICDDEKYVAVIGGFASTSVLASAPIYGENAMPQMVPAASHMDITKVSQYTWLQASVADEMRNFSDMVMDGIGSKRVAYIYLNNDSGLSGLELLKDQVSKHPGVELVAAESFNEGQVSDFSPLLSKLKEAQPETIMISAQYKDIANILKQAKQMDFGETKFANLSTCYSDEFLTLAGDDAEGFYVSTLYFAENPDEGVQQFSKLFSEASGGKTANQFASQAYECMSMLVYAFEQGAYTREDVYQALLGIKEWDGLTCTSTYTDRVPEKNGVPIMVKDGKWALAEYDAA